MGKAIPRQHPAVVLRSHFNFVRALLGVTMLAVVGLTIAVVIVANDNEQVGSASSPQSAPVTSRLAPAPPAGTRYDGGPDEGTRGIPAAQPPAARYDGGPEEGTRGIVGAQAGAAPLAARKLDGSTDTPRYDGGPEEGTRGPSATSPAPDTRYDGGPEEGSRGPGFQTN
jgi:hypothetical protein